MIVCGDDNNKLWQIMFVTMMMNYKNDFGDDNNEIWLHGHSLAVILNSVIVVCDRNNDVHLVPFTIVWW